MNAMIDEGLRNEEVETVRQHLIDPEECARCGGCADVCTKEAVVRTRRGYAIDPAICNDCGDCLHECQTGAIEHWRLVPSSQTYSVSEQLQWDVLPAQHPALVGSPLGTADETTHGKLDEPLPAGIKTQLFGPQEPLIARVVANEVVASGSDGNIHHVEFAVDAQTFPIVEGQSIGIQPPGLDEDGKPHHVRLYSLASPRQVNAQTDTLSLLVKRVAGSDDGTKVPGICSNFLCGLQPGAEAGLVGPFGTSFLMPDAGTPMILFATGVGIAPFRAMLSHRLRETGTLEGDMLFYGGRQRRQLAYVSELEQNGVSAGLRLHLALSRESGEPKRYVQDLLREHGASVVKLLEDERAQLLCCGVKDMQHGVLTALEEAYAESGIEWRLSYAKLRSEHRIKFETF